MTFEEAIYERDDDKFFAWLERGFPCPPDAVAADRAPDVSSTFAEGFKPPLGVLHWDFPEHAPMLIRLAQYGCGPALHSWGAAAGARCFDLPLHEGEDCGVEDTGAASKNLIGEALEGYWRIGEVYGGGEALAAQYADAVAALLHGGASRYVKCGISLAAAWPVVRGVWERCGVRLAGWASREFEARCWASLDAADSAAMQRAIEDLQAMPANAVDSCERMALTGGD